MMLYYAVL